MMKYLIRVNLLLIGTLLLAACGAKTPDPIEITIEMSEYSYSVAEINLLVGQEVTINFINNGTLDHEFMVGQNVMMMDGKASGFNVDFFESAGVEPMVMGDDSAMDMDMDMDDNDHDEDDGGMDMDMHSGFMVEVPNGKKSTMTFTVTEDMIGEWEIGCFLLDGVHYASGMQGTLTVTK